MLGANPKKAATPSTANPETLSSRNDSSNSGGLMVKAIDDIFERISSSENPQEFRVSFHQIKHNISENKMKIYSKIVYGLRKKVFINSKHVEKCLWSFSLYPFLNR